MSHSDRQYWRRSTGEAASGENRGQRDERLLQGVAVLYRRTGHTNGTYDRCASSPISAYWRTGTAVISTVSVASLPIQTAIVTLSLFQFHLQREALTITPRTKHFH